MSQSIKSPKQKKINLALQGGGAHGAFTWGVLDEFLKHDSLDFEGISAASAGSMNAVILTQGLMEGGSEAARETLEVFWKKISETGAGSPFWPISDMMNDAVKGTGTSFGMFPSFFSDMQKKWQNEYNSAALFMNLLGQNISPYQFNPLNLNPLKDILDDLVDFDRLRKTKDVQLFITATNVQTGDARIFKTHELTCNMVLASAALPHVFQAVEVDGDFFWDGGFVGNPSLWPLFYEVESHDVLIVHVNPIVRKEIPKDAHAIENRLNEITFNSAMLKELRAISFVKKLIAEDMMKEKYKKKYRDVLLHAIRAEETMAELELPSKYDTSWDFLTGLRDLGKASAKKWLDKNFEKIGVESTVDIKRDYLCDKGHK